MTNKEKWVNELIDICIDGGSFAVDKCGRPQHCCKYECKECAFWESTDKCMDNRKRWLEQEYSEPVYLSQLEHDILSALNPIWKYIIRDKDGQLSLFTDKPLKVTELGIWRYAFIICDAKTNRHILFNVFNPIIFSMIKWTDNAPWSIEKLLSLPVKD